MATRKNNFYNWRENAKNAVSTFEYLIEVIDFFEQNHEIYLEFCQWRVKQAEEAVEDARGEND